MNIGLLDNLELEFEKTIKVYEKIIDKDKDGELYSERVELRTIEDLLSKLREFNKYDFLDTSDYIGEFHS